jgi:hypothetical protein
VDCTDSGTKPEAGQGDPLQNTGTSKIEEITETEPTEAGNSSISNRKSSSIFL